MPLTPIVYAKLLGEKVSAHRSASWLVNTGWTGGPFGTGSRMKIAHTRALVRAALSGDLTDVPTRQDPIFALHVPVACPDVPQEILDPRSTWADGAAYDARARELASAFRANFEKFRATAPAEVAAAGPTG